MSKRTAALPRHPPARPARQRPTSLLLDPALIEALRRKGATRGLGYQTMLKLIVREHLDEY